MNETLRTVAREMEMEPEHADWRNFASFTDKDGVQNYCLTVYWDSRLNATVREWQDPEAKHQLIPTRAMRLICMARFKSTWFGAKEAMKAWQKGGKTIHEVLIEQLVVRIVAAIIARSEIDLLTSRTARIRMRLRKAVTKLWRERK